MQTAAALTMVRDDAFFLRAWLAHYGAMFGRENCYIVNHGRGQEVADLAEGCNIIGIPGDAHQAFDRKRWQLLNSLVTGLRQYYNHVVVGDVDELVVVDPDAGVNLLEYLAKTPTGQMLTPLGLEVIHRTDIEDQPITDSILGPRRHVRPAPLYSKPCVVSRAAKISRGGHYSGHDTLAAPDELYLFHLKYCDVAQYGAVMDRRNAVTAVFDGQIKKTSIGAHWFSAKRGKDADVFEMFQKLEMQDAFNLEGIRRKMRRSWGPRGDTGYYEFTRFDDRMQYVLPERFFGLI